MKKIFVFTMAAVALLAVSCNKEIAVEIAPATIEKTFSVTAPESTKTTLSGLNVLWSADDEINVIAKTTGNQYTFTLTKGAGTSRATFSGNILEADAEETEFFAVYPNVAIRKASLANDKLELDNTLGNHQTAVKGGYDPAFGTMTAVSDKGSFNFRHGMAYFKLKIGTTGVNRIKLHTSNTRFSGRPVFVASTGAFSAIEGAKDTVSIAPKTGTFEKDAVYYIPVPVKNTSLGTITITYYFDNNKSSYVSTAAKSSVKLELGTVYDLGNPPISLEPVLTINTASVSGVSADGVTNAKLANAYSLKNCSDGDVTVTYDGTVVTAASISDGTVTYSVSKNTGATRDGWIKLKLDGKDAQTIAVSQLGVGTSESYSWVLSDWDLAKVTGVESGKTISDFTENGLSFISNGKGKWGTVSINDVTYSYIQTGGKNNKTTAAAIESEGKLFKFSTNNTGTVTIKATNTGANNSARKLTLAITNKNDELSFMTQSGDGVTGVDSISTVVFTKVPAGTIRVLSQDDSLRIFEISFVQD